MHHKLDKETKNVFVFDKDEDIRAVYSYKSYLRNYNSDLLKVLKEHWEYKTQYHWTDQLDLNI
jgi:hypothetical protein